MLQGHLLPGLREVHRSSPQSPNLQGHQTCILSIRVCWLQRSLDANKCSELEYIIMTNLVILIGCSFQVVNKLVTGDDFFQFPIPNTKNIAEFLNSLPSAFSMTSTTFLVTLALNLSLYLQGVAGRSLIQGYLA